MRTPPGRLPLALLALSSLLAIRAAPPEAGATDYGRRGPRIRFEGTAHDFGKLRDDQGKVTHRWVYYNDGDEPLRILATRPSCGCTATAIEGGEVPPGGRGVIEVTFDPSRQRGSIRKSLAVTSNDPVDPTVLLTLLAVVEVAEKKQEPGAHPPITGQSLLMGSCGACHSEPARGKTGQELYAAVCAMCHGPEGRGPLAPRLREPGYLASRSEQDLATRIAYGTANPRMPGFSDLMGGPLTEDQIRSLVEYIRGWESPVAPDAKQE